MTLCSRLSTIDNSYSLISHQSLDNPSAQTCTNTCPDKSDRLRKTLACPEPSPIIIYKQCSLVSFMLFQTGNDFGFSFNDMKCFLYEMLLYLDSQ